MKFEFRATGLVLASALAGALASAQSTVRVSVSSSGIQGNGDSGSAMGCSLSADGRFLVFYSPSTNLVPGDTNGQADVFVRDPLSGTTELASVSSAGVQGNAASGLGGYPCFSISADGRFVVFHSFATNLVPGDTSALPDIFVRDRLLGTTERVNVSSSGAQANDESGTFSTVSVSDDGRFVAFESSASNLVIGDSNGFKDIFVRDRLLGTTERVSVSSTGLQGDADSLYPSLSADGRFVAFHGGATNLAAGDANNDFDVFVRDRQTGVTERVSLSSGGAEGNGTSSLAFISATGRFVVFGSSATNFALGDTNTWPDAFVRDRQLGTTERVSVSSAGIQGNGWTAKGAISADGRYVTFSSLSSNLVAGDTNNSRDVFVRDLLNGTTERVSVDSAGGEANFLSGTESISADGRFVVFSSGATNLVPGDTNGVVDVFLRDREGGPMRLCSPGLAGVLDCPCANPPAGQGRGCDNSSATGGARIDVQGASSLAADGLVFTTVGERPTATSIVLSGTTMTPTGLSLGQGVRCVTGLLKRLYVKTASGGSITAPSAGDLSVSLQHAALGDPLVAGQLRFYMVYYRDPIVLGGCAATSTFNATDGLAVSWVP